MDSITDIPYTISRSQKLKLYTSCTTLEVIKFFTTSRLGIKVINNSQCWVRNHQLCVVETKYMYQKIDVSSTCLNVISGLSKSLSCKNMK